MFKYILKRVLQAIPLLFIVSIISFTIINLAPGDPVAMFINPETSDPVDVEAIRISLGLDKPIPVRYVKWVSRVVVGDFGKSMQHSRPVLEMIGERVPNTLILAVTATTLSFLIAIPAGIISAVKRNSIFDYICSVVAFIGTSLPGFWFGLMMILVFSLKLGLLPSGGMRENYNEFVLIDRIRHLILPSIVMGMSTMASKMRYTRGSLLEVLRQDYVRTARSKGLAENVVIVKHALRNALLPVITLLGFIIPGLLGGAVITETIFSWPGIGRMATDAVFMRDYPVIMGVNLMGATMVIVGSLLADVLYAVADPRIKYH